MSVAPRNKGRYSAKLAPTAETYMDRKNTILNEYENFFFLKVGWV
jgi:hypothetical protein